MSVNRLVRAREGGGQWMSTQGPLSACGSGVRSSLKARHYGAHSYSRYIHGRSGRYRWGKEWEGPWE